MAVKGIREYDAKRMLARALAEHSAGRFNYDARLALVAPETDVAALAKDNPWLSTERLVVKPDQLFGKRGKNNLILLDADFAEAERWIKERMRQTATILQGARRVTGVLTHFLIEPFIPHSEAHYLAITTTRDADTIHFATEGGVDIEEAWENVRTINVPVTTTIDEIDIGPHLPDDLGEKKKAMVELIKAIHRFFADYHFAYLEMNPFILEGDRFAPLDLVAKFDDYAAFQCAEKWRGVEFPEPFGRTKSPAEAYVDELDAKTGASLKLTILNPKGTVWNLVAGGGASIIYADTVSDLGFADELANYGEYSGNPSTELTYDYTRTILDLMTQEKDPRGRPKFLLIGGGVANFTDVANTFTGIIQAIREYSEKLKETDVRIYVRRGGPHYKQALDNMRQVGEELGIPMEVYGPETHMTRIVSMALGQLAGAAPSRERGKE